MLKRGSIIMLSVCLFIYLLFGQSNEKIEIDSKALIGEWNLLNVDLIVDTTMRAHSMVFDSIHFIKKTKNIDGTNIPEMSIINDIMYEVFCDDYLLSYTIDSMRKENEYWLSLFDKNNFLCTRKFVVLEPPLIYSTDLKSLKGIEDHFTDTEVYLIKGWEKPIVPKKDSPIILKLPYNYMNQFIYINYGQHIENEMSTEERIIPINSEGIVKTNILASPKDFFLKNYKVIDYDESIISVLIDSEYNKLMKMSKKNISSALKKYGVVPNQKILVVGRFNPGRKQVVNPKYGEIVTGQVQSIEVINSDIFY